MKCPCVESHLWNGWLPAIPSRRQLSPWWHWLVQLQSGLPCEWSKDRSALIRSCRRPFVMTVVRLLYVSHRLLHWSIAWSKTNCNGRRTPKLMEECISSWMALMKKLRRWDGGGCCSSSGQKQWERLIKKTAQRLRLEIYCVYISSAFGNKQCL